MMRFLGFFIIVVAAVYALAAPALSEEASQKSDLYINPQPVEISGYRGSAMESFISLNGKLLFFNTDDDPETKSKTMHYALRTGPNSFRYLGELPGVNMHVPRKVEAAAPSLDLQGHIFFTSDRQYERDFHSVFSGDFDGQKVTNVHAVEGDINAGLDHSMFNMDMGISPDGSTLYVSKARFSPLSLIIHAPTGMQLLVARRDGDKFNLDPDSARILKNISTGLEYAPAISADGLELYFNRGLRIMVATRSDANAPFEEARELRLLPGFVEAPSISLDRSELFFHKKVDGVCCSIFRAVRNRR